MEPNAFVGKKTKPTSRELAQALGPAHSLWKKLLADLHLTEEWNSYSPKAGWSLKLKQKQRTILYLGPCEGCFRVAFVLGGNAVTAALSSDLPEHAKKLVASGTKYAEGTAVRFENVSPKDIEIIEKLATIKVTN